jgi:hypothetical protein
LSLLLEESADPVIGRSGGLAQSAALRRTSATEVRLAHHSQQALRGDRRCSPGIAGVPARKWRFWVGMISAKMAR